MNSSSRRESKFESRIEKLESRKSRNSNRIIPPSEVPPLDGAETDDDRQEHGDADHLIIIIKEITINITIIIITIIVVLIYSTIFEYNIGICVYIYIYI